MVNYKFYNIIDSVLRPAFSHGRLSFIRWFVDYINDTKGIHIVNVHDKPIEIDVHSIIKDANHDYVYHCVRGGNLKCLSYLYELGCSFGDPELVYSVISTGYIRVIRWFKSKGIFNVTRRSKRTPYLLQAVDAGELNMFKWLLRHKCKLNIEIFGAAVLGRNLDILKVVCESIPSIIDMKYVEGHDINPDIMEYLISIKCPGSDSFSNHNDFHRRSGLETCV